MPVNAAKQPGKSSFYTNLCCYITIFFILRIINNSHACVVIIHPLPLFDQVYTGSWGDHDGIIRCKLGEVVHYELGEEPEPRREAPVFDKPTRGTSVEKFREMVFNHLKVSNRTRDVQPLQNRVFVLSLRCDGQNPENNTFSVAFCYSRHCFCLSLSTSPSLESRLTLPAWSARSSLSPMATKTDGCHYQKPALHGPSCRWTR